MQINILIPSTVTLFVLYQIRQETTDV